MQKKKKNYSFGSFLKYRKDIANLWVLWACLTMPNKNNTINLWETLMLNYMRKIKLISHFLFKILHFKESCNLIDREHYDPLENQNMTRYGVCNETQTKV